ncbi:hypothetical protein MKW98_020810 [Papaver atlanticum]|uniref:DNA/RNA-binding protein Alba-like domain-containing protein n=1 Tax=Papaver atlanticum TaxID=357466 RepID=A0AAD4TFG3_9MAGN|nr:hypothetical protein MKW98_020810 [Papaver atlanticum]
MEDNQRLMKPREETQIQRNEIRICKEPCKKDYVTCAIILLEEKDSTEIVLKAMGNAINRTIKIAEMIKTRIADLHQKVEVGVTDICSCSSQTTHRAPMIIIVLSKRCQPPIPADQVKPLGFEAGRGGRGRGRRGAGSHYMKTADDIKLFEEELTKNTYPDNEAKERIKSKTCIPRPAIDQQFWKMWHVKGLTKKRDKPDSLSIIGGAGVEIFVQSETQSPELEVAAEALHLLRKDEKEAGKCGPRISIKGPVKRKRPDDGAGTSSSTPN